MKREDVMKEEKTNYRRPSPGGGGDFGKEEKDFK